MGYTCGRHLTKTLCRRIAKTCSTITEFAKKDIPAYNKALANGWLDEWFIRLSHKPFTKEDCLLIAKQCSSRAEFKRKSHAAYNNALQNGWIDEYAWFKTTAELRRERRTFTDDDVINASKKYTKLSDFSKAEPARCAMAYKRGLINKMPWLTRNAEVMNRKCLDCVYVYEFSLHKVAYIGRSVEPHCRDIKHHKSTDVVARYAIAHHLQIPTMKILKDGITYKQGAMLEAKMMQTYINRGWHLLNKAPAGSIGGLGAGKLTKTYCINVARKYATVAELVANDGSVYNKLCKCKWLSECDWLHKKHVPKGTWSNMSKEELLLEARKYSSRNELMDKLKSVYEIIRANGWMPEVFPNSLSAPKKVAQCTTDGRLICIHNSISDAAKALNTKNPCISAICRGVPGKHTCKGFTFKFVE